MAVTTVAPDPTPAAPAWVAPRRWTVEEFERLPDDLFPEGERVELIDGQIVEKMSQNDPHILAVHFTLQALMAAFGREFTVLVQSSLRIGPNSKYEPDLVVLRGPLRGRRSVPKASPEDVVLIVEVSDTTLATDQGFKVGLYAEHGIPEYWIVNVQSRTLEVRRLPQGGAYAEALAYTEDETVSVGSGEVAVADLLP